MLRSFEASGKSVDEAIDRACLLANRSIEELEIEILDLGGKGFLGLGSRDCRVRVSYEAPDEAPTEAEADKEPASAPAAPSTFGVKKSKKERLEQKKAAKPQSDFELKPIVTVDPAAGVPEEIISAAQSRPKPGQQPPRQRDQQPDRRKNERKDRPSQPREDRPLRSDKPRRSSNAVDATEETADALTAAAMAFLVPIFAKLKVEPELNPSIREGILWLELNGSGLGVLIGRRGETLNSLQYLVNLAVNKQRNDHVRLVLDVAGYRQGREETLAVLARKMADKAVRSGRRVELEPMNPHERRVVHLALQNDRRVDTVSHGEEPYRRVVISKRRHDRKPQRRSDGPKPAADTAAAPPPAQPSAPDIQE